MELASAFSARALGAPSLPPSSPSPRQNVTQRMGPLSAPVVGGVAAIANEGGTWKIPQAPQSTVRLAQTSGADAPTIPLVPEVETAGSLGGMLVRDARVGATPRSEPPVIDVRVPVLRRWSLWALVAVVALAGILVVLLRRAAPPPSVAAPAPANASAAPVATEAARGSTVAPATTAPLDRGATVAVSAAPSGSPQRPAAPTKIDAPHADADPPPTPAHKAPDKPAMPSPASTPGSTAAKVVAPKAKANPLDRSD